LYLCQENGQIKLVIFLKDPYRAPLGGLNEW